MHLDRSYLFAPGDNQKLLEKVLVAGADAVVLDLEDAVLPERKSAARVRVRGLLESVPQRSVAPRIFVRTNACTSACLEEDLDALAPVLATVDGLRVPKAESVEALERLSQRLAEIERELGRAAGSTPLTLTLESALGIANALDLARSARTEALCFGAADFLADIGANVESEVEATLWAKGAMVVAARAAGIKPPILSVYTKLDDFDGLRRSTESGRSLGFFGRSCIHPKQLETVHSAFAPQPREVERARRLLASSGGGAASVDGEFVDEAVLRSARATVDLADRIASPEGLPS